MTKGISPQHHAKPQSKNRTVHPTLVSRSSQSTVQVPFESAATSSLGHASSNSGWCYAHLGSATQSGTARMAIVAFGWVLSLSPSLSGQYLRMVHRCRPGFAAIGDFALSRRRRGGGGVGGDDDERNTCVCHGARRAGGRLLLAKFTLKKLPHGFASHLIAIANWKELLKTCSLSGIIEVYTEFQRDRIRKNLEVSGRISP